MTLSASAPHQRSVTGRYVQIVEEARTGLTTSGRRFAMTVLHNHLNEFARENPQDARLRALVDGCAYCLTNPERGDIGADGPFAPMFVLPDDTSGKVRVYPRPLGDVDDDVLGAWAELAADVSLHPLVRARLADLLWVRRHQPTRRWFQAAVEAYVQVADSDAEIVEIEAGLRRAVSICDEANRSDLRREPLAALERLARRTLSESIGLYGVCGRVLQTLAASGWPLAELLKDALTKYGSDPRRKSELLEIAIGASGDGDEIKRLRLEQIAVHEAAAEACTGLLRVSHLDTARQIATTAGLIQHEKRLTTMIERTDTTDDLHTVETTTEIDAAEVHAEAARIVGDDNLVSALLRFAQIVPTGDPEQSREFATKLASEHPLRSLMTRLEFGPEGGVTHKPADHQDRIEDELGQYDAMAIMFFADLTARHFLHALRDRYGPDLRPALRDCFAAAPAVSPDQADRIANALGHWASEDGIAAGSVIADAVEPLVRGVCRQLGISVTRTDGRVRSLSSLLKDLGPRLGSARTRYLQAALVDPRSLNLRNRAAHGLDPVVPRYQFPVFFHVACLLMCVSYVSAN